MLGAILAGLIAAVVVAAPSVERMMLQGSSAGALTYSPVWILGLATLAVLLQKFILDRRPGSRAYDGLADLLIHIHSPASPDSPLRWGLRGLNSFLLSLLGIATGPEGAAVEWVHGILMRFRPRSARWFEHRRRSDASLALACGVSAAFGAPFSGVLLAIETEIGGRTILSVVGSLVAFMATRHIQGALGLHRFDVGGALFGFRFFGWKEWVATLAIALICGAAGAAAVRVIRFSQDSLLDLFQTQAWIRILFAGVLIFLIAAIYRPVFAPPSWILEETLWGHRSPQEVTILFCAGFAVLTLVISGFGSIGVFWPLFALGGLLGYATNMSLFHGIPGFGAVAGLSGASAFWGAILGAPLTAAVLSYELTGNLAVLLPCLVAALLARQVRVWLRTPALVERDLEARGVSLVDGRSASVLTSVLVRDAMVVDHETVHEQEPVSELHSRLMKARYAFLPVVNAQGRYLGLLTADMIQEAWQAQERVHSNSPIASLLEAKDLIYRAGLKVPSVRAGDRLSASAGLFENLPCIPVLSEDGRVQGLLFAYNVRLAYDREVARRALSFEKA